MMRRSAHFPPSRRRRLAEERGSLLLTAMLFAIGLAIVLGSYLTLASSTLKLAHRSYFANDATNLADAGLEEALYCFNRMGTGVAAPTAWADWKLSAGNATRTLPTFNRDQNAVGVVRVFVAGYDGSQSAPSVISQATITPFDGGAPIIKTVQLALRRQGGTAHGLVAMNGLDLNGKASVDSFNSNPTGNPAGPWLPYTSDLAQANASVAVLAGKADIAKGAIHGNLYLGPGVSPPGDDDVTGTITKDYSAKFPMPAYPTPASVSRSYDVGSLLPWFLPFPGQLPAADGRYYYFCRDVTLRNFWVLPNCNVTIVGVNTDLNSGITLLTGSTLEVYIDGPISLKSGDDLNAGGWAGALRIYTTTTNRCTIGNKSQLYAWLQAPYADLRATGGNDTSMLVGFFLANTVFASGSMDFHYDESLQPLGADSGNSWAVTSWLELQLAEDRATVAKRTNNFLR